MQEELSNMKNREKYPGLDISVLPLSQLEAMMCSCNHSEDNPN